MQYHHKVSSNIPSTSMCFICIVHIIIVYVLMCLLIKTKVTHFVFLLKFMVNTVGKKLEWATQNSAPPTSPP